MITQMDERVQRRNRVGSIWQKVFLSAAVFGVFLLCVLILNIINDAFGTVIVEYEVSPYDFAGEDLDWESMSKSELIEHLKTHVSRGLARRFESEKPLANRSNKELGELLEEWVFKPRIVESWGLVSSLRNAEKIRKIQQEEYPDGSLEFRLWLNPKFLKSPQSSIPEKAGIRTALLGSLWMILITLVITLPMGVGTAIYLEEYAKKNKLTNLIQINIYNLAGVPSIIYGLLGLAVFVRAMGPLTSGALFGLQTGESQNGRTVLSAGLTLALLVLPIVIINAQEAIKATPSTLRQSSLGLGATRWQTVWHHILPNSIDRILTGTILAVSRAFGETAPLVVIGASTFIAVDPSSLFSQFTTLPIQIYQWTARPQAEFRHIAAAAILTLLVLLLGMNTVAIVMRNKYTEKRKNS